MMDTPLGVWSIVVEFTVPVTQEDLTVRYEGDAEVDFAKRAVDRFHEKLNAMTDGGKTAGWYIIREKGTCARRCLA